jgi:hypothetical protein
MMSKLILDPYYFNTSNKILTGILQTAGLDIHKFDRSDRQRLGQIE